jgi:histidine triad (HIT) family protein
VPVSDCIFCGIAATRDARVSAHHVFEDEAHVAFLDKNPLFPGHVLLVPRAHVETLGDLAEELVGPLFVRARRLARAVERACEAQGTFVAINNKVSQSVPHLHVHVVPRKKGDGLRGFFWPRQAYAGDEAMAAMAQAIRTAYAAEGPGASRVDD